LFVLREAPLVGCMLVLFLPCMLAPFCWPSAPRLPCSPAPRCSCVPGPLSAEAGLIYAQGALLVARTLLTDYVSWIEGRAGRWIIQQDFDRLMRVMAVFVGVSWAGGCR